MVSRRTFLGTLISSVGLNSHLLFGNPEAVNLSPGRMSPNLSAAQSDERRTAKIARQTLVRRHNPHLTKMNLMSPLTLGNGNFAFTADVTGLQTLTADYENAMPLCTMSQWGWHTQPRPRELKGMKLRLTEYETHGRKVGYHTSAEGQTELYNWLRENPHRLHLGQIGLCLEPEEKEALRTTDISEVDQHLDLWRGILTSKFQLRGHEVKVTTAVHPEVDLLAVSIESDLVKAGSLAVRFAFPYGSPSMQAADWKQPARHETTVLSKGKNRVDLHRTLDGDEYVIGIDWQDSAQLVSEAPHVFILRPLPSRSERGLLEFVTAFSRRTLPLSLPTTAATMAASTEHWRRFWSEGAAIELAESRDPRAPELERRIVLSQYLTAIQCSGSLPPQETGLTVNSWYGKFHLEMHWWHATHFALWNRLPLFERSLAWYTSILPVAKALAQSQGYAGARWPKMVGPEGNDSPSPIGPLLIWQQPHPIFYAELCYQNSPNRQTLERYRQIVFESAAFMASYAFFDSSTNRYVLGPPVIPAQENHPPRETWNPTFELAYWSYGLTTAQRWRERLGMRREAEWDRIVTQLSQLPQLNGVYLAHENCPETFTRRNVDHPSMLGAYGVLAGSVVDRVTMRRTLFETMKEWNWDQTWGWDYPMTAMTAARLGETRIAINALLMSTEKNGYLPNGHNWQRANLPCYLPGNGGLLYAVAMMAGGWRGSTGPAPGFPSDGSWSVRSENLNARVLRTL